LNLGASAEIGDRVRAARVRRGWTREALAFHSGVSWSAIAQIESGRRRNVRPSTLSSLSDALGVSLDYLVRGTSPAHLMMEHRALIYDSDDALVDRAGEFIEEGSERGEGLLAVTTKARIALLRRHLGPAAKSVRFIESARWYKTPGAALDAIRKFCDSGLERGAPWIRVLGEPVWEGRSDSEVEQWTRYESLLNLVFAASPISILCPYDARNLDPKIVRAAHMTHPQTAAETGAVSSPDYADPGAFVLDSRKSRHA
jgi:transcriptional regulator with XRE-family HTH domain